MAGQIWFDKERRAGWKSATACIVACLLGVGLARWYSGPNLFPKSGAPLHVPAAASSILTNTESYAAKLTTPAPAFAGSSASAALQPPPKTQEQRWDILAKSRVSKDRFDAFMLSNTCKQESEFVRIGWTQYLKQCELPPGKWDSGELRLRLIEQPALEGMPGGWFYVRQEGPDGAWAGVQGTPEYWDLEKRAYAAALARADPYALAYEAVIVESRGEVAQALTLNVAMAASIAILEKRDATFDVNDEPLIPMGRFRLILRADVVKQAIADGLKMAELAKTK